MENENKYGLIPDMDWIAIDKLVIDLSYQRDTSSRRSQANIAKIVKNFSWAKLTPLTVGVLDNGTYAVIDGSHRVSAVKQLGDIDKLPCWIVPNLTTASQADSFLGINKMRNPVNTWSIFKAKLARGDKRAVDIEAFLNACNIEVPYNGYCSKPNHTLAIAAIADHLARHNDIYLKEAFALILKAWPNKTAQLKKDILNTLVTFKIRNGAKAKDGEIVKTLASFDNANQITAKAKELKALDSSLSASMAHYKVFLSRLKDVHNGK
ncbi:MAG: ParB N-terminal domain-containing protein [Alphaproteobacteria bacterium]|nr:ParB N-terminal domain-containing protein [Alphaproteobacteria bacterium]